MLQYPYSTKIQQHDRILNRIESTPKILDRINHQKLDFRDGLNIYTIFE